MIDIKRTYLEGSHKPHPEYTESSIAFLLSSSVAPKIRPWNARKKIASRYTLFDIIVRTDLCDYETVGNSRLGLFNQNFIDSKLVIYMHINHKNFYTYDVERNLIS